MKTIRIFFVLLLFFVQLSEIVQASNIVNINQQSFRFSMTIPDGWDSIPSAEIKKKFGDMPIVLALYPKKQDSYFLNNYVLITVMPTVKSLDNYKFNDIVTQVKQMAKTVQYKQSDTLRIDGETIDSYVFEDGFHVTNNMNIFKDSIVWACVQDLLLTKFGYISIASYSKDRETQLQSNNVAKIISQNIKVDSDYKYVEPKTNSLFTIRNIAISVGVGILVFMIMSFIGKKKK